MHWTDQLFSNEHACIRLSSVLLCVGVCINAAENLFLSNTLFGNHSILNWEILRTSSSNTDKGILSIILNKLFSKRGFQLTQIFFLLVAILAFALAFCNIYEQNIWRIILFLLFLNQILIIARSSFGLDGSDQMKLILSFSLFGYFLFVNHESIRTLFLVFCTIQLLLSYFISGIAKLLSKEWRNGMAIKGIASTRIFGNQFLFDLVKNNTRLQKAITWGTILFEIAYAFLLVCPPEYCLFIMALGLVFHLSVSIFMGLNNFVWTFAAAYPIVLIIYQRIHL